MVDEMFSNPEELLRRTLENCYSDQELHTLATDLGADYESLPGAGKEAKARELVAWLQRRGELARLAAKLETQRPASMQRQERLQMSRQSEDARLVGHREGVGRGLRSPSREEDMLEEALQRQIERIISMLDANREELNRVRTELAVLRADMQVIPSLKRDMEVLRERIELRENNNRGRAVQTWAWVLAALIGFMLASSIFYVLFRVSDGRLP